MGLSEDDVREILRLIDESDLDEIRIDTPDLQLHVRRDGVVPEVVEAAPEPVAPAPPAAAEPPGDAEALPTVDSPMLGVFYRASGPGLPPYVEVGARVEPDTVVCLIEVMKMMNSIEAGIAGTVVEVCAENAALVEYGQPLFRIRPA
jgi:acetyl-CoA carboxylase biotin carboxyl carrier protein